jgi:hypothetical protein
MALWVLSPSLVVPPPSTVRDNLGRIDLAVLITATPGAMGAAYEFTRCASANLRQRDDAWNTAWGGFAAGSMLGLRRRQPHFQ